MTIAMFTHETDAQPLLPGGYHGRYLRVDLTNGARDHRLEAAPIALAKLAECWKCVLGICAQLAEVEDSIVADTITLYIE